MHDRLRPVPSDLIPRLPVTGESITSINPDGYVRLARRIFNLGDTEETIQAVLKPGQTEEFMNAVDWALITLSPREHGILRKLYSLDTSSSEKIDRKKIGKEVGVTEERIRQIEAKALRRLRHPTRAGEIEGILQALA